jgi:formate transporter
MTEHSFNMDAYVPAEMATRVETVGVAKAHLDTATMFALAVLAGAFIALGANLATILFTEHGLGYGVSRVAGGVVFSLGLMLVIVGGAELFTGNSPIVMWTRRGWRQAPPVPHDKEASRKGGHAHVPEDPRAGRLDRHAPASA